MKINDLIQEIQSGNRDAYTEIVKTYERELSSIVAYWLGDHTLAEDVVQRTFVKAYIALGRFETGKDFGAWLRTIARNEARNEIKKTHREKDSLRTYAEKIASETVLERMASPDLKQKKIYLDGCMKKLSANARVLMRMRYEENRTIRQIVKVLKRTRAAVDMSLSRARILLKECIDEQGRKENDKA